MDSAEYSDCEFEGFVPEVVQAAENNISNMDFSNNFSDISISDISDVSSRFEEDEEGSESPELWSESLTDVEIAEFTGRPGPVTILDASASEIDFFHLMFPKELYEILAAETNRYAESEQERKKCIDPKWRATNATEMRAYIAIQIIMGIIIAPDTDTYFTKDVLFRPTSIHEKMPRV